MAENHSFYKIISKGAEKLNKGDLFRIITGGDLIRIENIEPKDGKRLELEMKLMHRSNPSPFYNLKYIGRGQKHKDWYAFEHVKKK